MDQHAAQPEVHDRVVQRRQGGVGVLPRQRRQSVEASGIRLLGSRAFRVHRMRDLAGPAGLQPVDVAERSGAGDDRVDPGGREHLELVLEVGEPCPPGHEAPRRDLERVAVAVAAAARIVVQIQEGVEQRGREPVTLRIDDHPRPSGLIV